MARIDSVKVGEWAAHGLLWGGFLAPVLAILVTVAVGYQVIFQFAGLPGCLAAAAVQLLTWLYPRVELPVKAKLERKLMIFYAAKKWFALTLVLLFLAPLAAGLANGDWQPAVRVYGTVAVCTGLGLALIALAKTVSDRFSNFPLH